MTITIAGILTGLSTYYGSRIYNNAQNNADNKKIKLIKKALQDYFTDHHRLPKPTDYSLQRNDNNFGKEKITNTGDVSFDADIHSIKNNLVYKLKNKNRYIPDTFVQVEYITSKNNQYINTGVILNSTFEIDMKFNIVSAVGSGDLNWPALLGARVRNHSADGLVFGRANYNTKLFRVEINSSKYFYASFEYQTIYNLVLRIDKFSLNDNIYNTGLTSINGVQPIYLTAVNTGGGYDSYYQTGNSVIKIYYTRIRKDNTTVRDFIPCCKTSSLNSSTNQYSVCGLCDVHSKNENNMVFYGNSGSGSFGHGEPVQVYVPELEEENIKENMTYTMYRGIVPFKELKLTENDVIDMYGNYFEYYVPEIMTIEQGKTPSIYDTSNQFIKVGYRKKDSSWGSYSNYPCPSIKNGTPNILCNANKNSLYGVLFNEDPKQLTRLPYGFQEVEYIQSAGGPYINSRIKPTEETKLQFKINFQSSGHFLALNTATHYRYGFYFTGDRMRYDYSCDCTTTTCRIINDFPMSLNKDYEIEIYKGIKIDDKLFAVNNDTFSVGVDFGLFRMIQETGPNNSWVTQAKLYYFKMYQGGLLVRDFIPCYTLATIPGSQTATGLSYSAGKVGLFDLVGGKFYTDELGGNFIKGKVVGIQYLQPPYGLRVKDLDTENYLEENGTIAYVLVGNGMDGYKTCSLHKSQHNSESPQEVAIISNNITKNYQKYSAQNCLNANENSTYNVIGRNQFGTIGKEWTFYKGGKTDFFDDKVEYETLERLVENSKL